MTQPFASLPPHPTLLPLRRTRRQLARLLGCSLGCLIAGCAERYDIGAFRPQQLQTGDVVRSGAGIGLLIADGIEDADAVFEGVSTLVAGRVGDLDGDGFDDVVVGTGPVDALSGLHIVYGGPRPSDGVVRLAQRSSALSIDESRQYSVPDLQLHGDFDGDGVNDLVFNADDGFFTYTYALSDADAAAQAAALADVVQRWTEQPAFLWYGSPERPAQVQFPSDAVAFRAGDDLSSHLARALAEQDAEEIEADIVVSSMLSWLGDVDGDGHGDLALSTSFRVTWYHGEPRPDGVDIVPGRERTETVNYLYYGGMRLGVGGEAPEPDARLPGFVLTSIGDVDGDGLADVAARTGDENAAIDLAEFPPLYVLPGSAQRLAGDVSARDLGVPVQISKLTIPAGMGDLDGDGIGDLLSWRSDENQTSFDLVYGSPDLLQRPLDATRVSATFVDRASSIDMIDMSQADDYDGDGLSDLLLWKTFWKDNGSGESSTWELQWEQARLIPGSTTRYAGAYDLDGIQPSRAPQDNHEYSIVPRGVGDFDGDGHSDVVLRSFPGVYIKFGEPLQSQVIR